MVKFNAPENVRMRDGVRFNAPEPVRMLAYVAALSAAKDSVIESVKVYTVNNGRNWRVSLNGRWIATVIV